MDYDFVVFGYDVEWDEWDQEDRVLLTAKQKEESDRLSGLGDLELQWSFQEYFKSRDNTLNQVLLGEKGLLYTQRAKDSACSLNVDMAEDNRPRAVLRNILFALRYGHNLPKTDIREALKNASIIDQLITMLKAYRLGLEYDLYKILAKDSREVRSHGDPDKYLVSLLEDFELERGRTFSPHDNSDKRTIKEVLNRVMLDRRLYRRW